MKPHKLFGFTGTATTLQRLRHPGKAEPGKSKAVQSREFCGAASRYSTESSLSVRKSKVLEIIICSRLSHGTCKHDRITHSVLSSGIAAMIFWTSPMNYFYVGVFKASIYFIYLKIFL